MGTLQTLPLQAVPLVLCPSVGAMDHQEGIPRGLGDLSVSVLLSHLSQKDHAVEFEGLGTGSSDKHPRDPQQTSLSVREA